MKAHELAAITQQALEKRNKERPTQVFNDLISKMKSQAKEGHDCIHFAFSDSSDVVAEVTDMLEEAGYSVAPPERGVTKISWAKATDKTCGFSIAWVGTCKTKTDGSGFCDEHKKVKCRCGRQAIRECDATVGPFVCGFPTCGKCTHSH
jgi:hypothetical protein